MGKIEFEGLVNTRDLGGMTGADGRKIRHGLLYRSGRLAPATAADVKKLDTLGITKIVDLRSAAEHEEKPDPEISGAVNINLPILSGAAFGVTYEKENAERMQEKIRTGNMTPEDASLYMMMTYRSFIGSDFAAGQYAKFIRWAAENEGAFLWHCHAGKDRAGFGAVLIQECLGVSHEDIIKDYLMTNVYAADAVRLGVEDAVKKYRENGRQGIFSAVSQAIDVAEELSEEDEAGIDCTKFSEKEKNIVGVTTKFMSADLDYINAAYAEADRLYGGIRGYIRDGLKFSDADILAMREKYLER